MDKKIRLREWQCTDCTSKCKLETEIWEKALTPDDPPLCPWGHEYVGWELVYAD